MLSNSFTIGTVYTISVVQIPQRVQTLAGLSPLQAGYRILPLVLASPLGSLTSSLIHKRTKVNSLIVLLVAAGLQIVGSSLISILPVDADGLAGVIPPAQYGYEVLLGFGLGASISTLFLNVQPNIERRYITVALGAINQWRSLGGAISLAVVTSVMNESINSKLSGYLSSEQLYRVLQSSATIPELPESLQGVTRSQFGRAYNEQMNIVMVLSIFGYSVEVEET
ncbi:hypothetical protein EAF04_008397 [Stromatinia cepivora]|nr:hypothetical protein EAF04_008397 [Stromatinia cepivora]